MIKVVQRNETSLSGVGLGKANLVYKSDPTSKTTACVTVGESASAEKVAAS